MSDNNEKDVVKVFQVKRDSISLSFYVTEIIESKYGDIYFGFFATVFLRTYVYFTQQQIEALHKDFKLEEYNLTEGQSVAHILGKDYLDNPYLWKIEEEAKKDPYYLNLGLIYVFYGHGKSMDLRIQEIYKQYDEAVVSGQTDLMPRDEALGHNLLLWYNDETDTSIKNKIEAIKKYPLFHYCISDVHEVIMNKPLSKSYKDTYQFVGIPDYMDEHLLYAKNIKELVELLVKDKNVSEPFKKEMNTYLHKNIFRSADIIYTVNYPLINMLVFLLDMGTFKHFSELEKMIKIMQSNKKYFEEVSFYRRGPETYATDYSNAFKKIIKFLMKDVTLEKALRMYNIFHSFSIDMAKDLDSVDYLIDVSEYKDAKYLLTQISKRAAEKLENFPFENKNPGLNEDLNFLETFTYQGYSLKVVHDFKSLYNYGMLLSNCAGSNYTLKKYTDAITYMLYKDNKAKYMGCIRDGEFFQLKGFKNKSPDRDLFDAMFDFLEKNKFIKDLDAHTISKNVKRKTKSKDRKDQLYAQECVQEN